MNRETASGEFSGQMAPMLHFVVGRSLDVQQQTDLERLLERRLGPVTCVRHPPAIDDVRVAGAEQDLSIVVSACCELTSRRAKILVVQVLKEFGQNEGIVNGPS